MSEKERDQLLAELSHELRGPLAPIATGIEILKLHCPQDDTSQSVVAMMERQMGILNHVLNNLLPARAGAIQRTSERASHAFQPHGRK